uniref:Ovule protein n=1 Tax=Steinernema glaseri TaxID=37863 RepID=A0A1I7XZN9_9BILA
MHRVHVFSSPDSQETVPFVSILLSRKCAHSPYPQLLLFKPIPVVSSRSLDKRGLGIELEEGIRVPLWFDKI